MAFTRGSANYSTHGFISTHFSAKIPVKLDTICLAMDCVNREWETEFIQGGDIARLREFSDATYSDYTVDMSLTYGTMSENYQDIVIDQQKYHATRLDYVDQHQADVDALDAHADRIAQAAHIVVDTHLQSAMATAVPADNTIGATTLGSVIQANPSNLYDVCVDIMTLLRESNAQSVTDERPWMLVPPRVVGIMKKTKQLTPPTEMGDAVIRNGVVGDFAGFDVKEHTNYTLTAATGGADDYLNILVGYNFAHTFVLQINVFEELTLETYIAKGMRSLLVYGSKGVKPQGLGKVVMKF